MSILIYLIPLLWLILTTTSLALLTNQRFGRVLPLTFFVGVATLYASQFLTHSFQPGFYLLLALAVSAIPFYYYYQGRQSRAPIPRQLIITSGLVTLIALYLFFVYLDYSRQLWQWDELMHWGKMVKEMLRLDHFYADPHSTLLRHQDYPPLMATWEYLWCRLTGGYREGIVTLALHVGTAMLLLPALAERLITIKNKNQLAATLTIGVALTVVYYCLLIFMDRYGTVGLIYLDIPIAVMFALSVYLVYKYPLTQDKFALTTYLATLILLIGSKQIGVAFALVSLFYLALTLLGRDPTTSIFRRLAVFGLAMLAPLLFYLHWHHFIASQNITGQFASTHFTPTALVSNYRADPIYADTLRRFAVVTFKLPITNGPVTITYAGAVLIIILLLMLLARRPATTRTLRLTALALVSGALGYWLVLLILYLTCFERNEMLHLLSYPRYVGSYVTGAFLIIAAIASDIYLSHRQLTWRNDVIAALASIVILAGDHLDQLIPQRLTSHSRTEYQQLAAIVNDRVHDEDKIYIVYDDYEGDAYQVFLNYYTNAFIDPDYVDIETADFVTHPEIITRVRELIARNDYLLVVHASDQLDTYFADLNAGQPYTPATLYQVTATEASLSVSKVE